MFSLELVRTESGTGLAKPIVVFTKRAPFPAPTTAIPNNNNISSSNNNNNITNSVVA